MILKSIYFKLRQGKTKPLKQRKPFITVITVPTTEQTSMHVPKLANHISAKDQGQNSAQ